MVFAQSGVVNRSFWAEGHLCLLSYGVSVCVHVSMCVCVCVCVFVLI